MSKWPVEWLATHPGKVCPACGERAVRPMMGGMPTHEVFEAMDAGLIDIHLAGCTVPAAQYRCSACQQELDTKDGRLVPTATGRD